MLLLCVIGFNVAHMHGKVKGLYKKKSNTLVCLLFFCLKAFTNLFAYFGSCNIGFAERLM